MDEREMRQVVALAQAAPGGGQGPQTRRRAGHSPSRMFHSRKGSCSNEQALADRKRGGRVSDLRRGRDRGEHLPPGEAGRVRSGELEPRAVGLAVGNRVPDLTGHPGVPADPASALLELP